MSDNFRKIQDYHVISNNTIGDFISHQKISELKLTQPYFDKVWDGSKGFEIRSRSDRTFKAGEYLFLREYYPNPETYGIYGSRAVLALMTYVLDVEGSIVTTDGLKLDGELSIISIDSILKLMVTNSTNR